MPNFDTWLGTTAGIKSNRAEDAWRRIQQKPTSIIIVRTASAASTTTLSAQTVRVEFDSGATETNSGSSSAVAGAGKSGVRELTVFGIKDHAVQPDTDIQRGDQFSYEGLVYTVVDVITTLGELQAKARRTT